MSKKVLILGGTGILGQVLCNYLLNRDYEVIMFNRGFHKNSYEQAIVINGDRRKKAEIDKLKNIQVNAIIDTMGWYPETLNTIFELFTGQICSYSPVAADSSDRVGSRPSRWLSSCRVWRRAADRSFSPRLTFTVPSSRRKRRISPAILGTA